MKIFGYKSALVPFIAALMLVSSCQKEDKVHGPGAENPVVKQRILDVIKTLPKVTADRQFRNGGQGGNLIQDGWNFAEPGDGFNYSSDGDLLAYSENTNTLILTTAALGTNQTTGGTVVAGETSLDINYAFCFASDNGEDALGGDLFGVTNASTNGVSGVIGVSGDFEELQSADSTTEFGDIFHGLVFYFVYDGSPSGTYEVIDWLDIDWNDSTSYEDQCFAFIFDFKNGRLFLSSSGSIKVSGGSMFYSGKYFEVTGFLNEDGEYDLSGDNLSYKEVDGFGTMGCN
jgi:hypothetical protein